ncbi:L-histidine N(alpha)-methyltransferase [Portibacter lacus]|uniref:Dimethylhistidine N-methyltransferase n=1 Tax=Portibacter lacus TaxID=1099794 RepID=A0AA37WH73_9BACT|nr:L-histidine N(alpha)-methyltransferase [Portibacter lacus]GLR18480.1 dimethylhistidine N-methyltransferase [Portibacter lacus]
MANNTDFERDVKDGLSSNPKKLSSKYFYDDEGSRIFQEIMEMPEYYLTNAEFEILSEQAKGITDALDFGEEFSVIELGAGDGKKTFELLSYMVNNGLSIHYRPVDISAEAIHLLEADLQNRLPKLKLESLVGDYFKVLGALPKRSKPALFLFLGSNIGNYEIDEAKALMKRFNQFLQPGDKMLVGFDIIKNPRVILKAYDDPQGITRRFNLNLLKRMNRELGMDFNLDQFEFFPYYNPNNGELRSCLVSLEDQKVGEFTFEKNELIHTELSKKYSLDDIKQIAENSGFSLRKNFFDCKKLFADSLWEKG